MENGLKGTYLLVLQVTQPLMALSVGRLGILDFSPGFYVYVGSAFGSGGLPARLNYHHQKVKQHPHWHVDYLRQHADLVETWAVGCDVRLELDWVTMLRKHPELLSSVRGFGSSDTSAPTHLFFKRTRPSPRLLTSTLVQTLEVANVPQTSIQLEIETYDTVEQRS
jgi:Uri superfamily endonuclease